MNSFLMYKSSLSNYNSELNIQESTAKQILFWIPNSPSWSHGHRPIATIRTPKSLHYFC
jgi:hypothetical protein